MPSLLKLTGFQKTSNLVYFFLTVGFFALFCAVELQHLRFDGKSWISPEGSLTPDVDLRGTDEVPGINHSNGRVMVGDGVVGGVKIDGDTQDWVGQRDVPLRAVRERERWEAWNSPRGMGEGYVYKERLQRVAQQVHLWSVIPTGILLPLQFLPIMRRKYMTLHRWAGRALFVALMIGNITALKLGPSVMGGTITTFAFALVLAASNSFAMFKAWKGVRDLRLDVHRAWVIRTWGFACSILTLRLFVLALIFPISYFAPNAYQQTLSCAKLDHMFPTESGLSAVHSRYPTCANLTAEQSLSTYVGVRCKLNRTHPEEIAALVQLVFGLSGFLGFVVNTFLVESYLNWTKDEDERLKKVSAVRRKAKGWVWDEGKGEKMS